MIHCIIIEDEPLAIKKLVNYIDKISALNLVATFNSAISAIKFLKTNSIDLIFLDIEMKELTGIQFLESISTKSKVIITTAYEKYAIKGYELRVSDYLLKPITFERFFKACNNIITETNHASDNTHCKIFVKSQYALEGIDTAEILYIEGMSDYRGIITVQRKILTLQSFKEIIDLLPRDKFQRVHNSFVISLDKVEKIERNRILIKDKLIPISETYRKGFYKKINA